MSWSGGRYYYTVINDQCALNEADIVVVDDADNKADDIIECANGWAVQGVCAVFVVYILAVLREGGGGLLTLDVWENGMS